MSSTLNFSRFCAFFIVTRLALYSDHFSTSLFRDAHVLYRGGGRCCMCVMDGPLGAVDVLFGWMG